MNVVDKSVKDGKLISITFQVNTEFEKNAYRKLPFLETCPHCGKPVNPADEDLVLVVPNPLESAIPGVAMELGLAVTKCSSCGQQVRDTDQCDITSFPEIEQYVRRLRQAYAAAVKKAREKKGGSTGGQEG